MGEYTAHKAYLADRAGAVLADNEAAGRKPGVVQTSDISERGAYVLGASLR